jgi:hypothetical protein
VTDNVAAIPCRLSPAERKALADKAREEKQLQLVVQKLRMQRLRRHPKLTALLQRCKAEVHQRWAERKAQEEAAARAAEAAAARAADPAGAAAAAESFWLPNEAYEVWGLQLSNDVACSAVRKLYITTQLGKYGTDCLRALHRTGRELTTLEEGGVLSAVTCPVCRRGPPEPQQQQQQQQGAGPQQPADAAAAGLSAAAPTFVPHKFDGDRHSKSAQAYQVGIVGCNRHSSRVDRHCLVLLAPMKGSHCWLSLALDLYVSKKRRRCVVRQTLAVSSMQYYPKPH